MMKKRVFDVAFKKMAMELSDAKRSAESFFKTMKTEMVYHRDFETNAEAKLAISRIYRSLVQPA